WKFFTLHSSLCNCCGCSLSFFIALCNVCWGKKAITAVKDSYHLTLQQEQQKLLEAKHKREYQDAGVRVVTGPENARISDPKADVVEEEFEEDPEARRRTYGSRGESI
ncbi:hypothetical protein HYV87_05495, partial [Candidatus Woesearchaeota archaeon]|nr:hypothetical protein [Candidatus Woesearchaeota archaeon]